jgi:MFS family permease
MYDLDKARRKITFTLLGGQSIQSASIIMAFTVGSIAVVDLAGNRPQWTGVPSTVLVLGAALIAFPMGRLMDRIGRRRGLAFGHIFGLLGTITAGMGIVLHSLPVFLGGYLILGFTRGTLDQGRYAAGEASAPEKRARAISWVVLGGTVGAVLGPGLVDATSKMAGSFGLPPYSGPFFAGSILFALGFILFTALLRPDPQDIGRQLAILKEKTEGRSNETVRRYKEILRNPNLRLATGTLIFAQVTMIAVMVVTPIHMHGHHHELSSISFVIMAHTLGMFGLSFVTGWMVDRWGRPTMILAGGLVLAISCFMAPFSHGVAWLSIALFLLGLGWNWCFVAASTLLSDTLRQEERGRIQGLTDTMVNVSSGAGNLLSGLAFAAYGFKAMSWFTILLGLVPVALVILLNPARRRFAKALAEHP